MTTELEESTPLGCRQDRQKVGGTGWRSLRL